MADAQGHNGNPRNHFCVILKAMRKTAWIWFVGCAVWIVDGMVQLHVHALLHARLAFTVAMLFLAAGLFYRQQKQ
jgi:hypothetical protein